MHLRDKFAAIEQRLATLEKACKALVDNNTQMQATEQRMLALLEKLAPKKARP